MKHKARIALCCLIVCIICALTGCQLAREDAGENFTEDRLVGVLLTTEYLDLFDFEGYINDNLANMSGGTIPMDTRTEQYQGRLYATLEKKVLTNEETGEKVETEEYIFEGIDGISYFVASISTENERSYFASGSSGGVISDGHTSYIKTDDGEVTTLEGTVYVSSKGQAHTYFFNPVYQSTDGQVYATAGTGISTDGNQAEGAAFSQTMDASYTITENGKTTTDSISVKVSFSLLFPPTEIVILQMDKDSATVSRMEYVPGDVPTAIIPEQNTEYIVVETHKTNIEDKAQISRKLYGKDSESLEAFFCREDGICEKQWVHINWSK